MYQRLEKELAQCQLSDRYRLQRKLRELQRKSLSSRQREARVSELRAAIERSRRACETRSASIPAAIDYPPGLPISSKAGEIKRLLQQHPVLVVAGATGSGKTTQLPKICLEAGFGRRGLIGHTQPRRLAAVSVATRIAEEIQTSLGQGVGYQVRFDDQTSEKSCLKLMTDGILLAEIQQDRFLNRYEVIIVDEAHERSLNIDFLLGFLRRLLDRRSDLKVIITSATIDVDTFSRHFAGAPVVRVEGRSYPVSTRYAPLDQVFDKHGDDAQLQAIVSAVEEITRQAPASAGAGDILVFLSGEREIRETALALRKSRLPQIEILPLYARLRQSEQVRIFQPHQGRRVVLATNVAETSITVPGIRYVIDTGLARISRYSLQSKIQRLPIEPISQASADQRQGRCGRVQDGVCIRLYSEADFNARPRYGDPEIKRTNLASVILRMRHLRLGEIEDFPFLEPPQPKAVSEGFTLLAELNALTPARELTEAGRMMAVLPVDPRHARMLITAHGEGCLAEMLIIVSALSIQDPREMGSETRQQALKQQARFRHGESDFLGFIALWQEYEQQRQQLSQGALRKYCRQNFLSFVRMREWRDMHHQLRLACQQLGLKFNRTEGSYEGIHKSIISGSLNQIGSRVEGRTYLGSRNRRFSLMPSSAAAEQPPRWIVSGGLIETTQTFSSLAARIKPQWVEQMALHLVRKDYFDPHWSTRRQQVMAWEKVQLYGLVLVEKARVSFAGIDPDLAREIFIRDGLAERTVKSRAAFLRHNADFLQSLARQEEKLRRPDVLVSARDLVRFYDERLPAEVCDTASLERWLEEQGDAADQQLRMSAQALRQEHDPLGQAASFPDQAALQHNQLQVAYRFEPGHSRDGATIDIPAAILGQITQADLDWAIPGTIREKCIALIKGLPKATRKQFVPVSAFVDSALAGMHAGEGELLDSLIAQARRLRDVRLNRADFAQVELDPHLQTKVRVTDRTGSELGFGRDLQEVRKLADDGSGDSPGQGATGPDKLHAIQQQGLRDWTLQTLPQQLEVGSELVLIRYPALVDQASSVAVELFADPHQARSAHREGLLRLYMLRTPQQKTLLKKSFQGFFRDNALLVPPQLGDASADAVRASYHEAFNLSEHAPRSREEFESALNLGRQEVIAAGDRLQSLLRQIFLKYRAIASALEPLRDLPSLGYLVADIDQQLTGLFDADFLRTTPSRWLLHYPRYLDATLGRLEKAPHLGAKDHGNSLELQSWWQRYLELSTSINLGAAEELESLRWMIEEYRVSLFAQALGTAMPVSAKRLQRQYQQARDQ